MLPWGVNPGCARRPRALLCNRFAVRTIAASELHPGLRVLMLLLAFSTPCSTVLGAEPGLGRFEFTQVEMAVAIRIVLYASDEAEAKQAADAKAAADAKSAEEAPGSWALLNPLCPVPMASE